MIAPGFSDLAILIGLSSIFGVVANKFRQPPLLGYILAGIVLSVSGLIGHDSEESLALFSQIGIAFLLFILGLELNFNDLKKLGPVALITGIGQIIFTTFFGYFIALWLGFSAMGAFYTAIALTFSSTIVIVKLLASKGDLNSLYGKISIGFLLVQDIAAMLLLIFLGSFSTSAGIDPLRDILPLLIKIPVLIGIVVVATKYFLPWIIKHTNHDREILFLVIIGWALAFSALVQSPMFELSLEIGALLAGIALSTRKESLQIESWMRPLRDFFITVFFVLLGFHLQIDNFAMVLFPALALSAFVLIGNPLIVMIIMGALGYNSRLGFFISLTVAQISEFSLLVAAMGLNTGVLGDNDMAIITLVGGITMSISSYLIYYNQQIYDKLKPILKIFEFRTKQKRGSYNKLEKGYTVIFGFHNLGEDLYQEIEENKNKYLIVDYNPVTVNSLLDKKFKVIYGDMNDIDLYSHIKLQDARLIVSTVTNRMATRKLLNYLEEEKIETPVIVTSTKDEFAKEYYDEGANYVIYPSLVAGQKLAKLVTADNPTGEVKNSEEVKESLDYYQKRDMTALNKRLNLVIPD